MYDLWRNKLNSSIDETYALIHTVEDQNQLDEIKRLLGEIDHKTRLVNDLLYKKEELEN